MKLLRLPLLVSLVLAYLVAAEPGRTQISSDGTLSTNVNRSGNVFEITGGGRAGNNLFHSFGEFSVPTNNTAFFNNPGNIANIISRVTGGSLSNIDGLIRANGSANLILINPNGIFFGSNARLNIGGSFLGTTADALTFADGTQFSALKGQAPQLTVSVPVGLQLGSNPGAIRVQGSGHSLTVADPIFAPVTRNGAAGLQVQPEQTLALVGGEINLEGGTLIAEGGRIELGSVKSALISLEPSSTGWLLGYDGVQSFGDIELRSQSLADASGVSSGSIKVQGRRLTLRDGSLLLIQNQGFEAAGNIEVNAAQQVEVAGTSIDNIRSSITNETLGTGEGGDIAIATRELVVQGGGTIVAKTFSTATGGNIAIEAADSVEVMGVSSLNPSVTSSITSSTFGSGNSGNLALTTGRLSAMRGGTVASATFASGNGGNLNLTAELIEIVGVEPNLLTPSALSASTFNGGNAGNLVVTAEQLRVSNGGRVDASTFASGSAGNILVNASESVEVTGTAPGARNPSLIVSSANLVDESLQQTFGLPARPSGESGDVTINTSNLVVSNGALINVSNEGTGDAGNLLVNADDVLIDNQAGLTAATTSGQGGNITVRADSILWRRGSETTARAGGTGNGGNITFAADLLVALDGSRITATAVQGRGGSVQIKAQRIVVCPNCAVVVTSELGIDGEVEFVIPETGNLEFFELPQEIIVPEQIVALSCANNGNRAESEFTIIGRGGMPPNPSEPLSPQALVSFDSSRESQSASIESKTAALPPPAQGWYVNNQGVLVLASQAPTPTPQRGITPPNCHTP